MIKSKSWPQLEEISKNAPKKPIVITDDMKTLREKAETYHRETEEILKDPKVRFMLGLDEKRD